MSEQFQAVKHDMYQSRKELENLTDNLPGGIGIFNAFSDGRIQQVYLNDGYFAMLGVERRERECYQGFGTLKAVKKEDRQRLVKEVEAAITENKIFNADARVRSDGDTYKWINIRGKIASRTEQMCTFYVTYSEIDETKRIHLLLERNQKAVDFARERGDFSVFTYNLDTKVLTQDLVIHGAMGYPTHIENVPEYFLRIHAVHPDDIEVFLAAYERLQNGEVQSEVVYRLIDQDRNQYDWMHMYFKRIENENSQDQLAVGFAIKINQEQEHLQRYQAELQLKQKVFENSILYYKVNITSWKIEEYRDLQESKDDQVKVPFAIPADFGQKIVDQVEEEYKETVQFLFTENLSRRYKAGESTVTCEYRRYLKNKGIRWVRGTALIMKSPETGDLMAFVHIQDIDREKKHSLAMDSVLDKEIESVILLHLDSNMVSIEMGTHSWKDRNQGDEFPLSQELRADLLSNIVEEDKKECAEFVYVENVVQRLQQQDVLHYTFRLRNAAGKVERKSVRVMYLDKYKEEIVYLWRDITDLYKEEQRQKQKLEDAINQANAANRAKGEFLSNISHDMRTPLNAIIGFSGKEFLENATWEEKEDCFNKIHTSGRYLMGIINDVLDMSKIENQKMILRPEPYEITDFEKNIQTIIGEQCRQKGIEFVLESKAGHGCVMLDKIRFNQIFVNLLSNAVKYTDPGGKIELLMDEIETRDSIVTKQFIVRDNGIGMSRDFLPHAFDSFSQEVPKNRAQNVPGTGLGLSIVKRLVEMMHGTIQLESEFGKGTTYTIVMKVPIGTGGTKADKEREDFSKLWGMHILLCEDHPLNMQIARKLLENKGVVVDSAENGQIGLEKFTQSDPGYYDAILKDIRMPIMDGMETTKAIRTLERSDAGVPVIAMTANAFEKDMKASLKIGMTGYLTKPIESRLLYQKLEHCMKGIR